MAKVNQRASLNTYKDHYQSNAEYRKRVNKSFQNVSKNHR